MEWLITKFVGGEEFMLNVNISLTSPTSARQIGPVSMEFEIPTFNVSTLLIKYLRIANTDQNPNFSRWVRYVSQSSSYVSRI